MTKDPDKKPYLTSGKTLSGKIYKFLGLVENIFSIACFVGMTVMTLLTIVLRYFHIPFTIGDESTRYMMVSGLMIGISMGVRENAHQGVEGLVQKIPQKGRIIVQIFINWLTTATYVVLGVLSINFALKATKFGQLSPALGVPMSVLYYIMFIGFLLATLENIVLFYRIFIEKSIGYFEGEEAGAL